MHGSECRTLYWMQGRLGHSVGRRESRPGYQRRSARSSDAMPHRSLRLRCVREHLRPETPRARECSMRGWNAGLWRCYLRSTVHGPRFHPPLNSLRSALLRGFGLSTSSICENLFAVLRGSLPSRACPPASSHRVAGGVGTWLWLANEAREAPLPVSCCYLMCARRERASDRPDARRVFRPE